MSTVYVQIFLILFVYCTVLKCNILDQISDLCLCLISQMKDIHKAAMLTTAFYNTASPACCQTLSTPLLSMLSMETWKVPKSLSLNRQVMMICHSVLTQRYSINDLRVVATMSKKRLILKALLRIFFLFVFVSCCVLCLDVNPDFVVQ